MKSLSIALKTGLLIIVFLQLSFAQVSSVDYQLRYDSVDVEYDCYIVINAGNATTIPQRILLSTQYSIVTPADINISISNTYMPLHNNADYNGTVPTDWVVSYVVESPTVQPESNFHSITPVISQTGFFNNIAIGDSIKLFSFTTNGTADSCSNPIRIFINGVDPSSSDSGMFWADFSNGFTMGGSFLQLYNANLPAQDLPVQSTPPVVEILGDDVICIGETTQLSPSTGVIWASNDPNVATVTNDGVVLGDGQGVVTCFAIDSITGCTSMTDTITVLQRPIVNLSDNQICVGYSTQVSSSSGLTWVISDPSVVSISNSGMVTGIGVGVVSIKAIDIITGCTSLYSAPLNVISPPLVEILGDDVICFGETTQVSPSTGGIWTSSNPLVATVTNAGLVTGVQSGPSIFTFSQSSTGCSAITAPIRVNPTPFVLLLGEKEIFIGDTTIVIPSYGGSWTSSDVTIAYVTNQGEIIGTALGEVEVLFTDSIGCTSSAITIEVVSTDCIAPNAIGVSVTTNSATDGSATCMPTGGVSPYSYLWSNGETTQSINQLGSGTYTVIVNGSEGCIGYDTINVAFCPAMIVELAKENTTCFAVCDATITINGVSNGVAPLQYKWNGGQTTAQITGGCAGNYSLTITDANGCMMDTSGIIVAQPTILLVNAAANNTSAIAIPSGGTPPYSYLWSSGETTPSIFDIAEGYYTITVTDANGCQGVESVVTDISFSIDSIFHITDTQLGAIYLSSNNDVLNYSWTGPNSYTSTEEDITDLKDAGCYTVTMLDPSLQTSRDTTICINNLTGVDNLSTDDFITIYPNPTSGVITIDNDQANTFISNIRLYNIEGKQLKTIFNIKNTSESIVDISNFDNGVYILSIQHNKGISYKRIVLTKF